MRTRVREVRVVLAVETQKHPPGFSVYFSLILNTGLWSNLWAVEKVCPTVLRNVGNLLKSKKTTWNNKF